MAKRLLSLVKGDVQPDNLDAATMHELLTPGALFLGALSNGISDFLGASVARFAKEPDFPLDSVKRLTAILTQKAGLIAGELGHLFRTGALNGSSTLGLMQVDGLVIIAERINYARYLSHFRAVHRGAFFTSVKTSSVRKLLPEHWGFLCPVHTPDGENCGLLNHLARLCEVVCGDQALDILPLLFQNGAVPFAGRSAVPIIVDGVVVGSVPESRAAVVAVALRAARLSGQIPRMTEIVLLPTGPFTPTLYVFSTQQRMMRPVWNVAAGAVELIGTLEQIFMDIAASPSATDRPHREVHETAMLSLVASLIPFSDFNQSPRNMYQCQMAKQTMGVPVHTESVRTENKTYHLHYSQRPVVRTAFQDTHGLEDFPLGANAVVAVLSYTGYDMEDALILNKSAVERGFGHGCIYKTHRYIAREIKAGAIFSNSRDGAVVDPSLDLNGLPKVGTRVCSGDKLLRLVEKDQKERFVRYKDNEEGFIEQAVAVGSVDGGVSAVVLKFRLTRTPAIGDKFSSRHGQKGVLSFPWPEVDMPFTESGIRPDVIINPHAFPSRMTIAMLIESMCGKARASDDCRPFDATPFMYSETNRVTDHVGHELVRHGFNYFGNDVMYSGITGEQFQADIFCGLVYYQRLRHMVGDKFQVRATGKVNSVTRQPLKGRKKGGGIRVGEMERDGMLGHGVAFLLRDRFMWCSDGSVFHLCSKCGSFLFTDVRTNDSGYEEVFCGFCKTSGNTRTVFVPYVLKYLAAELAAMNIRMRFEAGPHEGGDR
jgi:DNA-directed RNA polymerase I subunit RPA2